MVLFTGYAQNDLPEFIMFMLNRIHEDIKREVNISIVGDIKNNTDIVAKKCYEMMRNTTKSTQMYLFMEFMYREFEICRITC